MSYAGIQDIHYPRREGGDSVRVTTLSLQCRLSSVMFHDVTTLTHTHTDISLMMLATREVKEWAFVDLPQP